MGNSKSSSKKENVARAAVVSQAPSNVMTPTVSSLALSSYPSTLALPTLRHATSNSNNSNRSQNSANSLHHRRKSTALSLAVQNGITGKFISHEICFIVVRFYRNYIDDLDHAARLELGCAIFFEMRASNSSMKRVMNRAMTGSIKSMSLKFLDMLTWLMEHIMADGIDLYQALVDLGDAHVAMGIEMKHFTPMLHAMHAAFTHYFPTKYTIDVKYAFDEVFSLAAQVMTGQTLLSDGYLMRTSKQFACDHIPFLASLEVCLSCSVGRSYLFQFLSQTMCDEIVIFLKELARFKSLMSNSERFVTARTIQKVCIDASAEFTLNLSFETRNVTSAGMMVLEQQFIVQSEVQIGKEFFDPVEREIMELLQMNHWTKFTTIMKSLQSGSFDY